jgi:hypothetical protein
LRFVKKKQQFGPPAHAIYKVEIILASQGIFVRLRNRFSDNVPTLLASFGGDGPSNVACLFPHMQPLA